MSKIKNTKESWNGKTYSEIEEFVKEELDSKAVRAENPTAGHLAALDEDGNPTDSGRSPSEFLTEHQPLKTVNGIPLTGSGDINIPKGEDAVNPFKGWLDSYADLLEQHPDPVPGDYAYVKGADAGDPVDIYKESEGGWVDSGRDVDTSNVNTFQTTQPLNSVKIVNDLETGGSDDVLSAEQGVVLKQDVDSLDDKLLLKKTTNLTDDVPKDNEDPNMKCVGLGYVKTGSTTIYDAVIRNHASDDSVEGPSVGWYRRRDNNRDWIAYKVVAGSVIQAKFAEGIVPTSDNVGSLYILSEIKEDVTDDRAIYYGGDTDSPIDIVDYADQGYRFRLPALADGEREMYLYIVTQNGDGNLLRYGTDYKYYMITSEDYIDINEVARKMEDSEDRLDGLEENVGEIGNDVSALEDKWVRHERINLTRDVPVDNEDPDMKCVGFGYVKTGTNTKYDAVIRNHASDDQIGGPDKGWYRRKPGDKTDWIAYKVKPGSIIKAVFRNEVVPTSANVGSFYILSQIKEDVTDNNREIHYGGGTTAADKIINYTDYTFKLPDLADGETEMFLYIVTQNKDGNLLTYGVDFEYIMETSDEADVNGIYGDLLKNDSYFDSGERNRTGLMAFGNGLTPLYEIKTVETLGGTPHNYEVPKTVQEKNVRALAKALACIKWTPKYIPALGYKIPVNITEGETAHDFYDEEDNVLSWNGIPYSSVKELDKYVGLDVSVYTFMTAVNNPYSLLYTENVNGDVNRSSWGIEYHGKNCQAYYGLTCSEITSLIAGLPTGYSVELHKWLYEHAGKMVEVWPQEYDSLRVGDVLVCYNGGKVKHCRLVAALERDADNKVTVVTVAEASNEYVRVQYGAYDENEDKNKLKYVRVGNRKYMDLAVTGYRGTNPSYIVAYRPVELYRNVNCDKWSFKSPTYLDFFDPFAVYDGHDLDYFVVTMEKLKYNGDGTWTDDYGNEAKQLLEASNKTVEYNNAICTFAGDKACFNDTDLIVINYDLDGTYSDFGGITVYDASGNAVLSLNSETIHNGDEYIPDPKQRGHAINVNMELVYAGKELAPGTYHAVMTKGAETYRTDWEVLETSNVRISRSGSGDMFDVYFSSSNATPFAIALCQINGHKLAIRELTDNEVGSGRVHTDLKRLANEQTGNALAKAIRDNDAIYLKMFFRGDYGVAVGKQECSSLFRDNNE